MDQIDFLPRRVHQHRTRLASLKRQGAMVALCAMVLAGLAWFNQGRVASARAELAIRTNQRAALQGRKNQIPSLQTQLEEGAIKTRISDELGSRLDSRAVLAELGRLLPPDSSLTSLECTTVEMKRPVTAAMLSGSVQPVGRGRTGKVENLTEARVKVVLTGVAPTDVDVAHFIGQLSGCPLFEDVQMGYAKTIEIDNRQRRARSFQVSCLLAR